MRANSLTNEELRSSVSLSSVFALRMLGLFFILPVFALYARSLEGGDDTFLVGLTLGIYGLTQGILQIPYGLASDRYGRKRVIIVGLLIFAVGSLIAGLADSVVVILIGRAIQGAGAISAAVTAFISDSVRSEVLTKAMAFVGSSISLTFAFSLVAAPVISQWIGVDGLFLLTAVLCILAIGVMIWLVPDIAVIEKNPSRHVPWQKVVFENNLVKLNMGIFFLHIVLMAFFVAVPYVLNDLGIAVQWHCALYLPAVAASFLVLMPLINQAHKHNAEKTLFLLCIATLAILFVILGVIRATIPVIAISLLIFFIAFNVLEALLPALVARSAPASDKGLALGVYNTTQSIGLFVGGALGGWLFQWRSTCAVYFVCATVLLIWLSMSVTLVVSDKTGKEI